MSKKYENPKRMRVGARRIYATGFHWLMYIPARLHARVSTVAMILLTSKCGKNQSPALIFKNDRYLSPQGDEKCDE